MQKKKILAGVLAAAMAMTTLADCGAGAAGDSSVAAGTAETTAAQTTAQTSGLISENFANVDTNGTKITFWHSMGGVNGEAMTYLVDNGNDRDAAATSVVFDSNGGALNILNGWKELYDAGIAPNVGRSGSDTATTDFTSGKAAMMFGSTASLKQVLKDSGDSFEVGTAYFSKVNDSDEGGVSIGGGSLWALNNNDETRAAATWRFIEFLISPESQAYWNAQTGYFPVTTAAAEQDTYKQNMEQYPQFQTAIDQLHDSAPQYAGALLSVFPESRQIVETEIEEMLSGGQTPEETVQSIADQMNETIETYNLING